MAPIVIADAFTRLKTQIQALVLDFDGTLTDNRELIGLSDRSVIKGRSHYDGQGISLLRDIGFHIAIATNESDKQAVAAHYLVAKWNTLPSAIAVREKRWHPITLFTGVGGTKKLKAVQGWLRSLSLQLYECAAMGDDLVDFYLMRQVGFCAAPCSAEQVIREMAHYVSERPAGYGAVRDFANEILRIRGVDQTKLRTS